MPTRTTDLPGGPKKHLLFAKKDLLRLSATPYYRDLQKLYKNLPTQPGLNPVQRRAMYRIVLALAYKPLESFEPSANSIYQLMGWTHPTEAYRVMYGNSPAQAGERRAFEEKFGALVAASDMEAVIEQQLPGENEPEKIAAAKKTFSDALAKMPHITEDNLSVTMSRNRTPRSAEYFAR